MVQINVNLLGNLQYKRSQDESTSIYDLLRNDFVESSLQKSEDLYRFWLACALLEPLGTGHTTFAGTKEIKP